MLLLDSLVIYNRTSVFTTTNCSSLCYNTKYGHYLNCCYGIMFISCLQRWVLYTRMYMGFPWGCNSWKWIYLAVNSDVSVWFVKLHSLGVSEGNYITIWINSLIHLNVTLFGYVVIVSLCIMIETVTWYFLIVRELNWKSQANMTYSIGSSSTVLAGKGYFLLYLCIRLL